MCAAQGEDGSGLTRHPIYVVALWKGEMWGCPQPAVLPRP